MLRFLGVLISIIVMTNTFSHAQNTIEFSPEEQEWIANHPIINFGYEANWPPYEIYEDGEYTGIIGEYVKLIEKETGIDMRPIPDITWNEVIKRLKNGSINVVPIAGISDDRKEYLEFTEPYISDPLVIVTRDDFDFLTDLSGLEGKTLCLPEDYYTIDLIKKDFPKIKITTARDVKGCLLEVSTSRADAFVGSLSVVSYYINKLGFANLKIASPTKYEYTQMGLAVTKDWVIFRDIVQKVLNKMPKEQHSSIKNKWIAVRYEHGVDTDTMRLYIFYALAFFGIIIFVFFVWNKTLRIQVETRKRAEAELKYSLELINQKNLEKDTLLKEIHHRVKNNLQIVYSLLNMQGRQTKNEDTLKIITEGKARIKSMSLIHQILYESDNLHEVNVPDYIGALKKSVEELHKQKGREIIVNIAAKDITLDLEKAIPLGLILNELLTNSYKHAFPNVDSGAINIKISKEAQTYYFAYSDNGVGVKDINLRTYKSLGMRLISRLSDQLEAKEVLLESNDGLRLTFKFN